MEIKTSIQSLQSSPKQHKSKTGLSSPLAKNELTMFADLLKNSLRPDSTSNGFRMTKDKKVLTIKVKQHNQGDLASKTPNYKDTLPQLVQSPQSKQRRTPLYRKGTSIKNLFLKEDTVIEKRCEDPQSKNATTIKMRNSCNWVSDIKSAKDYRKEENMKRLRIGLNKEYKEIEEFCKEYIQTKTLKINEVPMLRSRGVELTKNTLLETIIDENCPRPGGHKKLAESKSMVRIPTKSLSTINVNDLKIIQTPRATNPKTCRTQRLDSLKFFSSNMMSSYENISRNPRKNSDKVKHPIPDVANIMNECDKANHSTGEDIKLCNKTSMHFIRMYRAHEKQANQYPDKRRGNDASRNTNSDNDESALPRRATIDNNAEETEDSILQDSMELINNHLFNKNRDDSSDEAGDRLMKKFMRSEMESYKKVKEMMITDSLIAKYTTNFHLSKKKKFVHNLHHKMKI